MMAEKESGRYLYEQYVTKPQNNGTGPSMTMTTSAGMLKNVDPPSSLKSSGKGQPNEAAGLENMRGGGRKRRCCACISPKAASFWLAMMTNLGIFGLLLTYTLLGKYFSNVITFIINIVFIKKLQ